MSLELNSQIGIIFANQTGTTNYNAPSLLGTLGSDDSLRLLANTGVNWVTLHADIKQDHYYDTFIYTNASCPTDTALTHAVDLAHRLGLKVCLRMILLTIIGGIGSVNIGQGFDAGSWTAWFKNYKAKCVHYAKLAASTGCEMLNLGTELNLTETHTAEWLEIIAAVRHVYRGPLTYSKTGILGEDTFGAVWPYMDYIGIDAYPSMGPSNDPTLAECISAWNGALRQYNNFVLAHGNKPVMFTEIGCTSRVGGAIKPADPAPGNTDNVPQTNYLKGFLQTAFNYPWCSGFYWYDWAGDTSTRNIFTWPTPDTGPFIDYSPYGKPAEQVLRDFIPPLMSRIKQEHIYYIDNGNYQQIRQQETDGSYRIDIYRGPWGDGFIVQELKSSCVKSTDFGPELRSHDCLST